MRAGARVAQASLLTGLSAGALVLTWCGPAAAQETRPAVARERHVLERAEQLESAGREDEALALLESWLNEVPTSVSTLVVLSRVSESRGEPARALPFAERAVAADEIGLPVLRQIWIRCLAAAGALDSARAVAERWVDARPGEPPAYSELASLHLRRGDREAAISTLLAGREATSSDMAFVQELALLWTESGRYREAAAEWLAMLSWGDVGVDAVHRHVTEVASDRDGAVTAMRRLVDERGADSPVPDGTTRLALRLGEHAWARQLVTDQLSRMSKTEAIDLLETYVAQARDAGDARGAAWGARDLASRVPDARQADYWRTVGAELSLDAGDREAAGRAFDAIRRRTPGGADAHRLAVRRLHDLTVASDPAGAEELLAEYASLYPEDERTVSAMSLSTADAWLSAGGTRRARSLLRDLAPADAETVGRREELLGRLSLLEGNPDDARTHLERAAAAPSLDAGARTRAVRWLVLLERTGEERVGRLGVAVGEATGGDPAMILEMVESWASESDAAPLCALAAEELHDAGFESEAAAVRERIVERWPDSAEAPAALLALARRAAGADPHSALRWLERLILEHPNSALAPTARREAARLERRRAGG